MTENKPPSILDPEDDAPDLSTPEWQAEFAKAKGRRGRPKLTNPKTLTTIRFDPEGLAYFQAAGEGWQTRINDALKTHVSCGQGKLASRKPKPTAETT